MITRWMLWLVALVLLVGCERSSSVALSGSRTDEPVRQYRNVETAAAYVGDEACVDCHAQVASRYRENTMARSFHPWTPATRIERPLDQPLFHEPSGFYYTVIEEGDELHQVEFLIGPGGQRLHELRKRIDHVMGSGAIARTYFTEENGRLFQLPLTWYKQRGWDFSPGYEITNARFDRLLPDRCLACHGSYPDTLPYLEGKYRELVPGIGCERCHGPGALHVRERSSGAPVDSAYDATIVNPKHLSLERRVDVCDQCHVHTPVTVLREGQDAFSYMPSQSLSDHAAFFKAAGSIDIVSHADRLRQSPCFVATKDSASPLECGTCHNPHESTPDAAAQNAPCRACHPAAALESRLASSLARSDHGTAANCVECHMPQTKEQTVPHGTFTDHWIRVTDRDSAVPLPGQIGEVPIEPYYGRDRQGSEAAVYQAMGQIVFGTLAPDAQIVKSGAQALRRALRRDSGRGEAQFLLGLAYRQLGMTDEAIGALERAVAIDSSRPQRLHALARAYEGAGRDPATVELLYQRALDLQPALASFRADYARFLSAHERYADAEGAFRAALMERPSLDVATFNLGTLLAETGRFEEASEVFRQALRLNPQLGEAISSLVQVRVQGGRIIGVRRLGSPLGSLPVRGRGANAVQLAVPTFAPTPAVTFDNVPSGATVRVLEPDGTLVRALRRDGPVLAWDLTTERGTPVAGGLYHVEMRGQDASGRALQAQRFSFGIVRQREP